jgi:hypothetical protein
MKVLSDDFASGSIGGRVERVMPVRMGDAVTIVGVVAGDVGVSADAGRCGERSAAVV